MSTNILPEGDFHPEHVEDMKSYSPEAFVEVLSVLSLVLDKDSIEELKAMPDDLRVRQFGYLKQVSSDVRFKCDAMEMKAKGLSEKKQRALLGRELTSVRRWVKGIVKDL